MRANHTLFRTDDISKVNPGKIDQLVDASSSKQETGFRSKTPREQYERFIKSHRSASWRVLRKA